MSTALDEKGYDHFFKNLPDGQIDKVVVLAQMARALQALGVPWGSAKEILVELIDKSSLDLGGG